MEKGSGGGITHRQTSRPKGVTLGKKKWKETNEKKRQEGAWGIKLQELTVREMEERFGVPWDCRGGESLDNQKIRAVAGKGQNPPGPAQQGASLKKKNGSEGRTASVA